MLNGKNILITGGTGTFGKQFVKYIAEHYKPNNIIIFGHSCSTQDADIIKKLLATI